MYVPRFAAVAVALLIAAGASYANLVSSVRSGDAEAVSALLAAGTDPNSAEPDGPTALYFAANDGHSDVSGRTPLGTARMEGHEDTAVLLREHGGVE